MKGSETTMINLKKYLFKLFTLFRSTKYFLEWLIHLDQDNNDYEYYLLIFIIKISQVFHTILYRYILIKSEIL